MMLVFFNGPGEWFIEDEDRHGRYNAHSELVCYIEYDTYNRNWQRIYPHNNPVGLFMLTDEDENRYKEKELRHKKLHQEFDKFNLNFVNTLLPLPPEKRPHDAVKAPNTAVDGNRRSYFKRRKYENSEPNFKDRLDYTLDLIPDHVGQLELVDSTNNTKADISNEINKKDSLLDPRAETSYLRIIAALLEYISGETPGIDKHPSFESESKFIEKIDELYGDYRGISKRTLEDKFPKAKASLKDSLR